MVFTCKSCGFEFSRRYNLHRHIIDSCQSENGERGSKILTSEGRKQFCLDLIDFTHTNDIDVCEGIVRKFLHSNPKWSGNVGEGFAKELKDFEKDPASLFEGLKNLCCRRIVEYALTAEDKHKTEAARITCCCRLTAKGGKRLPGDYM